MRTATFQYHSFRRNCRIALSIVLFCAHCAFSAAVGAAAEPEEIWLLVDTSSLTLKVMQGEDPLREYDKQLQDDPWRGDAYR